MTDTNLNVFIVVAVLVALLCAFASGAIASNKGLSAGGFFFLGLIFGVFGLLVAAVASPVAQYAPNWYPDPWKADQLRWHDGYQWTEHIAESR